MRTGPRLRALLRHGWPALFVALAIGWQYRAPLSGRVWYFEDIRAYFVPLYAAAARAMRSGAWPIWEPGAWSGQPLVGDPQLGLFYPPNWLWLVLSPLRLYAWLQLFHAAVAATGMWALCRARGRSRPAAAVGAVSLATGAFMVLELRHAMFVATTAWLPWLLWAIERFGQRAELRRFWPVPLFGALALLAGGWSMLAYGLVVIAILAVSALLRAPARRRVALGLALGGLGAAWLAAVQIFPALAHERLSPRALGTTYAFASSYAWPSWHYVWTLLFPTLYGDDARGTWIGAPNQWELCGYAIGVVGALLALCSLGWRERRGERIALFVVTLLACDLARGGGGLMHPLIFHLPVFGALRCPARALYVWTLAAPILAADGADLLAQRRRGLAPLCLLVLTAELLWTFRGDNPTTAFATAAAPPSAITWLLQHGRSYRATNDVYLGQAWHNMGLQWDLKSAGGYHSLPIWRYLNLLWIANHGAPYPKPRLGDDLTAQGLWRFSSPVVDALGVRFVVTPRGRPIWVEGFRPVFTGPDGIDVWENTEALPPAFVVYGARVLDEAAAAQAVGAFDWRPGQEVFVERPVAVPPPSAATPPFTAPKTLVRTSPTELALEVALVRPGILVLAEPWYPGWQVSVDGAAAPLLRVDYALQGVALAPGRHRIAFSYRCRPLALGGALSLSALLLSMMGIVATACQRRTDAQAAAAVGPKWGQGRAEM